MFFCTLGLLAVLWASFNDSGDTFVRIVVGVCGAIIMALSIKLYKLNEQPKLEEEY